VIQRRRSSRTRRRPAYAGVSSRYGLCWMRSLTDGHRRSGQGRDCGASDPSECRLAWWDAMKARFATWWRSSHRQTQRGMSARLLRIESAAKGHPRQSYDADDETATGLPMRWRRRPLWSPLRSVQINERTLTVSEDPVFDSIRYERFDCESPCPMVRTWRDVWYKYYRP